MWQKLLHIWGAGPWGRPGLRGGGLWYRIRSLLVWVPPATSLPTSTTRRVRAALRQLEIFIIFIPTHMVAIERGAFIGDSGSEYVRKGVAKMCAGVKLGLGTLGPAA